MTLNGESKQKRDILMADMGLLFVALFWGAGFVAGKFALEGMGPLNITAYRYAGAALLMLLLCLRRLRRITKKMILWAGLIGFLMFLGNTLQTIGLQYTTPGKQSFIISLYTVLVPLLSWILLRVRPSRRILAAAFIALAGIALLTLKDDFTIGLGDGLTFGFAITFSLQVVFIGMVIKDMDAMVFTFLQLFVAAALSVITALIFEPIQNIGDLNPLPLAGMLYLIVINSTCAFLLQNLCQRVAPASHTAILLSLETVFGTIFAVTLAGEVFRGRMIAGCILMFAAIAIAEIPVKRGKRSRDEIADGIQKNP
ncbi:MAG: DMT family transporter [Firmicutes bacterium]|nr:DMT family transporter [Bacillota bacterium]